MKFNNTAKANTVGWPEKFVQHPKPGYSHCSQIKSCTWINFWLRDRFVPRSLCQWQFTGSVHRDNY